MSRAYKEGLKDLAADLGATGTANAEKLSGADLAQVMCAVKNGATADVTAAGRKNLGANKAHSRIATVTAGGVNTVTVANDVITNLQVGMIVDILANDYATVRAADRTITAINYATKVLTYSGADASAAIVAGDVVVKGSGVVNSAALTGADMERFAGDQ